MQFDYFRLPFRSRYAGPIPALALGIPMPYLEFSAVSKWNVSATPGPVRLPFLLVASQHTAWLPDVTEVSSDEPTSLLPDARKRALIQGALGVVGTVAWFAVVAYLGQFIDSKGNFIHAFWHRVFFSGLGLMGLTTAVLGLWRLSVARDKKFDWVGIGTLFLIIVDLLALMLWLFYAILAFHPGAVMGG